MTTTIASVLDAMRAEPSEQFIPTRYPYTYALDLMRQHPEIIPAQAIQAADDEEQGRGDEPVDETRMSRGVASVVLRHWANREDRVVSELASVLAEAYLTHHHVAVPADTR